MNTDVFKNIIDIFAANVNISLINFSGMGEPLIDPDFISKIRYASQYTEQVIFYTNGKLLTEDVIVSCRDFIFKVFVSVHGDTPEEYEQYSGYKFDQILSIINVARDFLQDRLVVINYPNGNMSQILGGVTAPHPIHNWGDDEISKRTGSDMQGCKYPCAFDACKVRIDGSVSLCGQDWNIHNNFLSDTFPFCNRCQHKDVLLALRDDKVKWDDFIELARKVSAVAG
jgi:hypothetical protein